MTRFILVVIALFTSTTFSAPYAHVHIGQMWAKDDGEGDPEGDWEDGSDPEEEEEEEEA